MCFGDELNNYMKLLKCNSKDICDISGISPTVISRYLNNKRTPKNLPVVVTLNFSCIQF